jgi:hypothetical protein
MANFIRNRCQILALLISIRFHIYDLNFKLLFTQKKREIRETQFQANGSPDLTTPMVSKRPLY